MMYTNAILAVKWPGLPEIWQVADVCTAESATLPLVNLLHDTKARWNRIGPRGKNECLAMTSA